MKDIENAINHFKWKFTQSNSKASNKDKSSLNTIIKTLNEQSEDKVNDNLNFCKLFLYSFKQMALKSAIDNNYKTIDFEIIYNRLRDALRLDAKEHIKELYTELNQIEIQSLILQNKLNHKTIASLTSQKEIEMKTRRMLNEFIKNN
mgnify:CR=1 FL=1|tara:strand:+ start:1022 stop:1462 length:441 start_codon:yes stop_codon:yes gene_type:complete